MKRFFEVMYPYGTMPVRGTVNSAGYDLYAPHGATIGPGETVLFKLGVRAFMQPDEVLMLHVRSSVGIKKGLILANATGVIDSDYYGNESNGGEICVCLRNVSDKPCYIAQGEKIAQGVFMKYLIADNDTTQAKRTGGVGSTDGTTK